MLQQSCCLNQNLQQQQQQQVTQLASDRSLAEANDETSQDYMLCQNCHETAGPTSSFDKVDFSQADDVQPAGDGAQLGLFSTDNRHSSSFETSSSSFDHATDVELELLPAYIRQQEDEVCITTQVVLQFDNNFLTVQDLEIKR